MHLRSLWDTQTYFPADLKDVFTRSACWEWGLLQQAAFLAVWSNETSLLLGNVSTLCLAGTANAARMCWRLTLLYLAGGSSPQATGALALPVCRAFGCQSRLWCIFFFLVGLFFLILVVSSACSGFCWEIARGRAEDWFCRKASLCSSAC